MHKGVPLKHNDKKEKNLEMRGGCWNLRQVVGPRVGLLQDGPLARVVQHGLLSQRDIRRHPGGGG